MALSGCSHRVLDFTLISTKNVDLSKGLVRGKSRVEGKDRVHIIFIFPTGVVNIKEAVDRAIESTPGCVALLDGVIYSRSWYAFLYGQMSATIEGLPLIDPSQASNIDEIPDYRRIDMDRNGNIKTINSISEVEYLALKSEITKGSPDHKIGKLGGVR